MDRSRSLVGARVSDWVGRYAVTRNSRIITAEALIIGGGGGGAYDAYVGYYVGPGGGAGGVLFVPNLKIDSTPQAVVVGAGGAAHSNGTNSSVGANVASAGGYGNAGSTGPGGGTSVSGATPEIYLGTYPYGQGHIGGLTYSLHSGGGGGGSGEVGFWRNFARDLTITKDNYAQGGLGGSGTDYFSTWASATSSGDGGRFAGGGGGGHSESYGTPSVRNNGGAGGGGRGGGGPTNDSAAGLANTGGGGGGGGSISGGGSASLATLGKAGGSGIVIIRYLSSLPELRTTGSPNIYVSGGYRYYKFTGAGSVSI